MMRSAAVESETVWIAPPVNLAREQAWLVQATVAHVTGVPLNELCAHTRCRSKAAFARQIAMYLGYTVFDMRLAQIARAFGRHRSTARHAIRLIEELRENPELDRLLCWMEAILTRSGRLS